MLIEMLESQKYHDIKSISMKSLPKIGFIACLGNQPIAAGFLRRVEGNIAQLDGLTSNAHFHGMIRHDGINLVVDALIEEAKRLKLDGIIATTSDLSIVARSKILGFHEVPQTIIALKL